MGSCCRRNDQRCSPTCKSSECRTSRTNEAPVRRRSVASPRRRPSRVERRRRTTPSPRRRADVPSSMPFPSSDWTRADAPPPSRATPKVPLSGRASAIGEVGGTRADIELSSSGRFHAHKIDCAQNCAHAIGGISITRFVEHIVDSRVTVQATVFSCPSSKFAFRRIILEIYKCLRGVHLQTRGEVAERLKAAVC